MEDRLRLKLEVSLKIRYKGTEFSRRLAVTAGGCLEGSLRFAAIASITPVETAAGSLELLIRRIRRGFDQKLTVGTFPSQPGGS